MRGTVFVLSFAATCFGAQASSIIAPAGPTTTPSVIMLGAPEAAVLQPAARADPGLDPMQRALAEMKPGDWQAASYEAARTAALPGIETPSIIALGEPEPGISYDRVAAIPQRFSPMVVRGGIVGGPSADPLPARAEPAPAQAARAPDQAETRNEPSSSASQSQQDAAKARKPL